MTGRVVSLEEADLNFTRTPGHEPDAAERALQSRLSRFQRQRKRLRPRYLALLQDYRHMHSLGLGREWWAFHAPARYRRPW